MTETEVKAKSLEKVEKIQALAKELQISIIAQQIVDRGSVIQNKVCYIDQENYVIDKTKQGEAIATPVHTSKPLKENESSNLPK